MKIIKLILLACPAFLVSMLLLANPAHASRMNYAPTTSTVAVVSVQPTPKLATPHLTHKSNQLTDKLGCNCASCLNAKFQQLQGKLPVPGI